ncbi:hypothetical protein QE152_g6029 [Popillia japonica]|uniref:Uncharacterized protein n=1 Tax=Popillia japonica TaxID=7064 RepID=A0AAW1MKB7_POPJA
MSSKRLAHRKGVVSSSAANSLDWDSPSAKTGTVKRRPVSSDCSSTSRNTTDSNTDNDRNHQQQRQDLYYMRPPKIQTGAIADRYNYSPSKSNRYKYKKPTVASAITYANLSLHDSINSGDAIKPSLAVTSTCLNLSINSGDAIKPSLAVTSTCLNLTESGKLTGLNSHRNGKVSDSDSGIASPLSPSSTYAFLVYYDGSYTDGEERTQWNLNLEWLENCSCAKQQIQVKICMFDVMYVHM